MKNIIFLLTVFLLAGQTLPAQEQSPSDIVAWVGNIGQIQNLKSEILRLMYLKLKEKGIKTV